MVGIKTNFQKIYIMVLKNGDIISYRGCWGNETEKDAKLVSIERTKHEHEKYGIKVNNIEWDKNENSWTFPFVATLDNNHWAYSYQLKPNANMWMKEPEWYGDRKQIK